jgi:hypothetical protein
MKVESSWNVMAHGEALERKWSGNWRMEWVASTLHTTSEHGVCSIITADAHTSAASSWLHWRSRQFKWTRQFRRKTKSGFLRVFHHISTGLYLAVSWCKSLVFKPVSVGCFQRTIQHNITQYNTIQHNTTQYNTIQHNITQYNTIQHISLKKRLVNIF